MIIGPDDSFLADGQVVHFSRKAFAALAGEVSRCFACGADESVRKFNNEHVIPDWVLARYNLHSRRITVPNGQQVMYGRYTLRCCEDCNARFGKEVESPISIAFSGSYEESRAKLAAIGPLFY